jgi:hypothetical protein
VKPLERETPAGVFVRKVVEVTSTRGAGTPGDPVRQVVQYWSADEGDGQLLAEKDPCQRASLVEQMVGAMAHFRDRVRPDMSAYDALSAAIDLLRAEVER